MYPSRASDKAPGPDEISNRILKNMLPTIEQHLQTLMQASLKLGHFPKPFKHTTTVVGTQKTEQTRLY